LARLAPWQGGSGTMSGCNAELHPLGQAHLFTYY
jgi:hypothetical protein